MTFYRYITNPNQGHPRRDGQVQVVVWRFFITKSATNLENRMTVCMGYTAMTPKRESRRTPPEGGRKTIQGEQLNVDSSVTRKQCGQIDHIVFCNASERRVISMYMTNEEWEQNNQDYLKES